MAPRKRISKIPTRVVAPEVLSNNGLSRSIGIQTDVQAPEPVKIVPTKRQKILEKIKKLSKASQKPSASAASSSSLKPVNPYPYGFVPTKTEKACQVDEKEFGDGSGTGPRTDFAKKMNHLKSVVDRRRVESIIWDRNRLISLHKIINGNPPPRWELACDMWLEVDQLEKRILAFQNEVLMKDGVANEGIKELIKYLLAQCQD